MGANGGQREATAGGHGGQREPTGVNQSCNIKSVPAIHAIFTWGQTGANYTCTLHVGKNGGPRGATAVGRIPGAARQAPALEDYRTLTAELFREKQQLVIVITNMRFIYMCF